MKPNHLKWAAFVWLVFCTTAFAQEPIKRFQAVADRLVDAINGQDHPRIQKDFAKVMLDALPPAKSKPFFDSLVTTYGKIKRLDAPRFTPPNRAVFPAQFERGTLDLTIVLDEQDKIIGLTFLPGSPSTPAAEKNSTPLRLPFKGKWLVFWGGDTREQNQHHDAPNQRFAFDFVQVDATGKTHKNQRTRNEDYFAFGQEILSPADGVVTDVIQGVADNTPGSMNVYSALGNAIYIKHRDNEVSILAHFKQGSIRVKVGDKVKKGQVLGLCGNSGHSSEPHLHYHLQNTSIIQDGKGIKCHFTNVLVNRGDKAQKEENHSPVKSEIVSHE
jgi:murein DD-endopeptidase MepM/ murein hydrolase activator NlpD